MVLGSNFQRRAIFRRAVLIASESRWARRKTRVPDKLVPANGDSCDAMSMPSLCHRAGAHGLPSCSLLLAAVSQHAAQGGGVTHGVAAAVVVEIREDFPSGAAPLPDPVRPPAQFLVRVGTAVQVLVVGPVQPDVDERCGRLRGCRAGWRRSSRCTRPGAVPAVRTPPAAPSSDGGTPRPPGSSPAWRPGNSPAGRHPWPCREAAGPAAPRACRRVRASTARCVRSRLPGRTASCRG